MVTVRWEHHPAQGQHGAGAWEHLWNQQVLSEGPAPHTPATQIHPLRGPHHLVLCNIFCSKAPGSRNRDPTTGQTGLPES